MSRSKLNHGARAKAEQGFTLIELIATVTILTVLALMATPLVQLTVKRERERELRRDLWEMRDAIDRYKDAADRGAFRTKVDSGNKKTKVFAPDTDRPDDEECRLGPEVDAGRSRLRLLWRAERV